MTRTRDSDGRRMAETALAGSGRSPTSAGRVAASPLQALKSRPIGESIALLILFGFFFAIAAMFAGS